MSRLAAARSADAPPAAPPGRLSRLLGDPRRALLIAAVLAAFTACVDVLDDPDLWWHLRLGRWILDNHAVSHHEMFSYTAAGNAMTAHEWGSEALFALVQQAGGVLTVALLMALVGWSALVALALRARARGVGPVVTAVAVLLGARAAEPVFGTRPQVLTVALVCWTLLLAERHLRRGGRWVWVLVPLGLVWANLHGGFVLGVAALALTVALEALRRVLGQAEVAPWRRIVGLAAATAGMGAAACLNPNGPGLYRFVVQTSSSERLKPITEWHSPDFHDPANVGLLILLVTFALLLLLGGRPSLRDFGMSVIGLGAALVSVRNTSLVVALALPAWAVMLQQVSARVAAWRASAAARSPAVVFGVVVVALAMGVDGVVLARAAGDAATSGVARVYPACAASTLQSADGVRVFAPYFHSGYLVDQLWSRGHVYLYGESASLGLAVFDDYERILGGGTAALRLLADSGTNAVVTGPGALRDAVAASADWRHVLDDRSGLSLYATPQLASSLTPPRC